MSRQKIKTIRIRTYVFLILITLSLAISTLLNHCTVINAIVSNGPNITITSPTNNQEYAYFSDIDDIITYEATVQADIGYKLSSVKYKLYSDDIWHSVSGADGETSITFTVSKKASEIRDIGLTTFSVKATEEEIFGTTVNTKQTSVNYYIITNKIMLVSPAQNAYLDFDKGGGQNYVEITLNVQSSDRMETYITDCNGQLKHLLDDSQNPTLNFHDLNTHTVIIPIWLSDLTKESLGGYSSHYLCYNQFRVTFKNYFMYNSKQHVYSLIYNFNVLWNRAEIHIYLSGLYTGDGNDKKIEYFFKIEQLKHDSYNVSSIKKLDKNIFFSSVDSDYWTESEYLAHYCNGGDGGEPGWWRKDSNGNVYTIEEQRRCVKTYDRDYFLFIHWDQLRFTVYYWISPNANPDDLFISGRYFSWQNDGHDHNFYWDIQRATDWGDYFFNVYVKIHVYATRNI